MCCFIMLWANSSKVSKGNGGTFKEEMDDYHKFLPNVQETKVRLFKLIQKFNKLFMMEILLKQLNYQMAKLFNQM